MGLRSRNVNFPWRMRFGNRLTAGIALAWGPEGDVGGLAGRGVGGHMAQVAQFGLVQWLLVAATTWTLAGVAVASWLFAAHRSPRR